MPHDGHSKRIRCPTVQKGHVTLSDLDPMTLILKLDLDMVKMSQHTTIEVSMSRNSKSDSPNGQTDTQTV